MSSQKVEQIYATNPITIVGATTLFYVVKDGVDAGINAAALLSPANLGTGSSIATKFLRGDGTWQSVSPGSGDVVGPASATDNALVSFDGITGKLIKACTTLPAQFATDSAASPADGTFTGINVNGSVVTGGSAELPSLTVGGVRIGRNNGGEASITGPNSEGTFRFSPGSSTPLDFFLSNEVAIRFLHQGGGSVIEMRDISSLGSVTGGARIGAISGFLSMQNSDGGNGKIAYLVSAPSTASSSGAVGQIACDATHFYVCIATDAWIRASFASW